ncbi:MAG TPA: hypothetical protein DD491_11920 [Halieaceae bacterium]|nr:hypothetical protein [Halieaceae bacterium]
MQVLSTWHDILEARDPSRLGEILAEDCVFYSPVVHTPQAGRELTALYLTGAMHVFNDSFRYLKEVVDAPHAVLEFSCRLDDIEINGVDIITVNAAGLISEFKVMVRPLKAVNLLHERMRAMLEQIGG